MNIKDYLKYYLGQQYRHKSVEWLDWSGWFTLKGADIDAIMHPHMQGTFLQLALRKLEDMTEEEVFGMAVAGGLIGTPTRANIEGNFIQMEYVKDGEILVEHWHPNELNAHHFHFLLSCGFDLFGLIDAGLGIDSKTVTI